MPSLKAPPSLRCVISANGWQFVIARHWHLHRHLRLRLGLAADVAYAPEGVLVHLRIIHDQLGFRGPQSATFDDLHNLDAQLTAAVFRQHEGVKLQVLICDRSFIACRSSPTTDLSCGSVYDVELVTCLLEDRNCPIKRFLDWH